MQTKDILNLDEVKGSFLGVCYRGVCNNTGSTWFNHSTKQYYCVSCAAAINEHNRTDAMRMYKHDLCTNATGADPLQAARDFRDYFEYNLTGSHNAMFTAFIMAAKWAEMQKSITRFKPFNADNNLFVSVFNKILADEARPEEIEYAKLYAKDFQQSQWPDKLYQMLKQIFDQYSDEWTAFNEQAVADLLTEYQTRLIP